MLQYDNTPYNLNLGRTTKPECLREFAAVTHNPEEVFIIILLYLNFAGVRSTKLHLIGLWLIEMSGSGETMNCYIHTCTYIHACMHTHIHTLYIHTYIHTYHVQCTCT